MPKECAKPVTSLSKITAAQEQTTVTTLGNGAEDWSFAHLTRRQTRWGPHGYHRYPAKFIPHLVRHVIDEYAPSKARIGDPFVGSATTGVEALRSGRAFWGGDINPVAVLIGRAKCAPLQPQALSAAWMLLDAQLKSVNRLGRRALTNGEKAFIEDVDIARATGEQRLNYWFPQAHRDALSELLTLVRAVPEPAMRMFFLCGFSNILRGCSIWLSGSTKPQKDLTRRLGDPVEEFRRQMRAMLAGNALYWDDLKAAGHKPATLAESFSLQEADARKIPLDDGALDFIVTSPPYATCYQYLEIHQLTQLWFEKNAILSGISLRDACIGGKGVSSRGGQVDVQGSSPHQTNVPFEGTGSLLADAALSRLAERGPESKASAIRSEVRALQFYFRDMNAALGECNRVLNHEGRCVLIVGDSRKRGVDIPTSAALREMAQAWGFKLEHRITREIPARVLVRTRQQETGRFSSTAESDTQVYAEEDILIFKRQA